MLKLVDFRTGVRYHDDMSTNTPNLIPVRITTTDRVVVIMATDVNHAHRLFTGKEWPPNVPAAPSPADRVIPGSGGVYEPTPEWSAWHRDQFLPARAQYPVLDWPRGECMLSVELAEPDTAPGTESYRDANTGQMVER